MSAITPYAISTSYLVNELPDDPETKEKLVTITEKMRKDIFHQMKAEDPSKKTYFVNIPNEIWVSTLLLLPISDLLCMRQVCKD